MENCGTFSNVGGSDASTVEIDVYPGSRTWERTSLTLGGTVAEKHMPCHLVCFFRGRARSIRRTSGRKPEKRNQHWAARTSGKVGDLCPTGIEHSVRFIQDQSLQVIELMPHILLFQIIVESSGCSHENRWLAHLEFLQVASAACTSEGSVYLNSLPVGSGRHESFGFGCYLKSQLSGRR